ncbi:hypothetical protein HQ571_06515 [Candidatus Kuenenbacteria bacterium]|nr:hypothetical protein [Candidatus Kuenenbacteria bacterium]
MTDNKIEIEKYQNLLELLKGIEGLNIENTSAQVSLAFLIEEIKKKNPDNWEDQLKKFIDKINEANTKDGYTAVSWLLSESISSAYMAFLEKRKQEVQDESLKRKIEIIKKMAENSLSFNSKTHDQGKPVAFGGVSLDYIPEWYHYVEMKK